MWVIIPCGAAKASHPAKACELYTGAYFRAGLRYARSLARDDCILILSAKRGLVHLHERLAPYDLKMGQQGSVSIDQVRAQASALGILHERPLILGGLAYRRIARAVWPEARQLTEMLGPGMSIGRQIQWLNRNQGHRP